MRSERRHTDNKEDAQRMPAWLNELDVEGMLAGMTFPRNCEQTRTAMIDGCGVKSYEDARCVAGDGAQ